MKFTFSAVYNGREPQEEYKRVRVMMFAFEQFINTVSPETRFHLEESI
jgi:hypothetical protein